MVLLESQNTLKTGELAPEFELLGTDGRTHSNIEYTFKKGLLVVFMCNHCPYVKAKVDTLNEIYRKYSDHIHMVGINSNDSTDYPEDSYENMKKIAKEKKFGFDYLVDDTQKVAKKYGAMCTPDSFLFNEDQKLVFHGRLDDGHGPDGKVTTDTMSNNIETMLYGDVIKKDFEPSIGCSIKWKET